MVCAGGLVPGCVAGRVLLRGAMVGVQLANNAKCIKR